MNWRKVLSWEENSLATAKGVIQLLRENGYPVKDKDVFSTYTNIYVDYPYNEIAKEHIPYIRTLLRARLPQKPTVGLSPYTDGRVIITIQNPPVFASLKLAWEETVTPHQIYLIEQGIDECGQNLQEADDTVASTFPSTRVDANKKTVFMQRTESSGFLYDLLRDWLYDHREEVGEDWKVKILSRSQW